MREPIILPENSEPTRPVRIRQAEDTQPRHLDGQVTKHAYVYPRHGNKAEILEALTKARLRDPQNKALKNEIYEELKAVIDQDPFLAYEDESEAAYKIHDHADAVLIVPKERAVPEPFPQPRPEPIRKAYRFLLWAVLGLVVSGLGALIFAPAAGLFAAQAASQPRRADRVRARVVLGLAVLVFALGLALAYLFLLHWVG